MREWQIDRILPNHGSPDIIANGGYGPELIDANRLYLERISSPDGLLLAEQQNLKKFIAQELEMGGIVFFEPYEAVHRENIEAVKAVISTT